ncbi:MAG: hybrid sensor histidine kinase/response regulator [Thermoflexales bacterium]|nr:hybrid sensor histidine kinase/response regulator [Thermoflexales bacterium]
MNAEAAFQGRTLVIVDDDAVNMGVITDYLETFDLRILTALDGQDALETVRAAQPDLILLDVVMPGLDGWEVCRRLKAEPATCEIPVIFMTALASTEDKLKGFEAGGVDYVTKPVRQEELLARVRTHLKIRQLTQGLQVQNARLEKMANELEGLYRQAARSNEQLEHMVHQRTRELEEAYRMLEMMDKAKADFIQVAAHELRTPLTLIEGYGVLIEEEAECSPGLKRLVEGILTGERRLHEIVANILDVSKIESQVLQVSKDPVQMLDIFEGLRSQFESILRERRLELTMSGLDGLPALLADAELLTRMFQHLLVNAIKYTPDSGSITVRGSLVEEGGNPWLEIVVQDTGIGIDPAYHELIFASFYQTGEARFHSSGKTKFKGGGPGLGLAIARGIVQAHGGRIWVESPGHDEASCPGSAFHVMLPVLEAS